MPATNQQSLIDIIVAVKQVVSFAQGTDVGTLANDSMKLSAILYQVAVIGEATKRLTHDFRGQHPEIPWRQMAGMRDRLIHEYDAIDVDVVWTVATTNLPELLPKLEVILAAIPSSEP
jgi:uncharacterized protein with HEPN domain